MHHDIVVYELESGRTFEVECSCGDRWVAFFGDAQVEEIISRHYDDVGVIRAVVLA